MHLQEWEHLYEKGFCISISVLWYPQMILVWNCFVRLCRCVCVCVYVCVCVCVCVRARVRGPACLGGAEWYGVMLQRPTDKLIHLLTLLTRLSDFVKWTIDQASSLSPRSLSLSLSLSSSLSLYFLDLSLSPLLPPPLPFPHPDHSPTPSFVGFSLHALFLSFLSVSSSPFAPARQLTGVARTVINIITRKLVISSWGDW